MVVEEQDKEMRFCETVTQQRQQTGRSMELNMEDINRQVMARRLALAIALLVHS